MHRLAVSGPVHCLLRPLFSTGFADASLYVGDNSRYWNDLKNVHYCLKVLACIVAFLPAEQARAPKSAPSEVILPEVPDASELESQKRWLAGEVQLWLDDEWTKLDVHRELGEATAEVLILVQACRLPPCSDASSAHDMHLCSALTDRHAFLQAYAKARLQGIHEVGEVLLSISSDLLSFNFKETFVNAFDVST